MRLKRFELPGYDLNYFYDSNLKTPADRKVEELNDFLEKNGIKGGIKLLNDGAVLEIDDSVSGEKLEKIKRIAFELLKSMGATESQLVDVFKDIIDKEKEIEGIMKIIAHLETSISGMHPQTPEEWEDYDHKVAILMEKRDRLLHLTHSDEEIKQMEIDSIKETIANLETSISGMHPQTPEEWEDYNHKVAILMEKRDRLLHLTHSDEEIKQMEIDSIKETIANLETSISGMHPQTPEEWEDYDHKVAILMEKRDRLLHLTHSDE